MTNEKRQGIILSFADIKANKLGDLLHPTLKAILDKNCKQPYTIFLTASYEIEGKSGSRLTSMGIKQQRKLLEKRVGKKSKLTKHWSLLSKKFTSTEQGKVSSRLIKKCNPTLSNVNWDCYQTDTISNYMRGLSEKSKKHSLKNPEKRKECEFHIIDQYLSIYDYSYFSYVIDYQNNYKIMAHLVAQDSDIDLICAKESSIISIIQQSQEAFEQLKEKVVLSTKHRVTSLPKGLINVYSICFLLLSYIKWLIPFKKGINFSISTL